MQKRATQLRDLLTKLGPSFVKVGQALSSRPDLLPKPYLEVGSRPATLLNILQSLFTSQYCNVLRLFVNSKAGLSPFV